MNDFENSGTSMTKVCSVCGTQIPARSTNGLCPRCLLAEALDTADVGADVDATIVPSTSVSHSDSTTVGLNCGDYELLEEIARGGMGVVYKARHAKLNRVAAIKMILGGKFSSEDEIRRFHVEAEAAARLDHPGIVPVYDIGEQDGQAFFAMKYIEGGSLAEKIGDLRRGTKAAIQLLSSVARAVHHAHQRGILHRDLKPANILIDEDGQPLITDLGLAKSTAGDSNLTKTGAVVGTPSYMPPEQAGGEQSVTTAVDIYSLGAILYELLTGQPPHAKETPLATVMSVLNEEPKTPRQLNSSVDVELELICLKCIERRPEDRYASAADLAKDLECWLAGEAISLKPPSLRSLATVWIKQNRRVVYGFCVLLLGLALGVPFLTVMLGPISMVGGVYQHFPNADRPWFVGLHDLPSWLPGVSMVVMVLFVWPSIGLWNAIVMRPKTIRGAFGFGGLTSLVCALVLGATFGWYFVAWHVSSYSKEHTRLLGQVVWTPDGSARDEAIERVDELYDGLTDIPVKDRPEIYADRVLNEQMARGPNAWLFMYYVCLVIAVPVTYGTVLSHILLQRKNPFWLFFLRYTFAWSALTLGLLLCVMYAVGWFHGKIVSDKILYHLGAIVLSVVIVFLAMRRWRSTPGAVSEEMAG